MSKINFFIMPIKSNLTHLIKHARLLNLTLTLLGSFRQPYPLRSFLNITSEEQGRREGENKR